MGFITKVKGANAFRYTVRGLAGVVLILGLINGKFRTSKIHTLHGLIIWLNNHYDYNLPLLPIDGSDLGSNAWLAGFCDADWSFYIRYRANKSKNPSISANFKLEVASTHAQTGGSLEPIMSYKIILGRKSFFGVTLYLTSASTYRVDVTSKAGFVFVINYFNKYPLFTYKHFKSPFMACVKVHEMLVTKAHRHTR